MEKPIEVKTGSLAPRKLPANMLKGLHRVANLWIENMRLPDHWDYSEHFRITAHDEKSLLKVNSEIKDKLKDVLNSTHRKARGDIIVTLARDSKYGGTILITANLYAHISVRELNEARLKFEERLREIVREYGSGAEQVMRS